MVTNGLLLTDNVTVTLTVAIRLEKRGTTRGSCRRAFVFRNICLESSSYHFLCARHLAAVIGCRASRTALASAPARRPDRTCLAPLVYPAAEAFAHPARPRRRTSHRHRPQLRPATPHTVCATDGTSGAATECTSSAVVRIRQPRNDT